MFSTSMKVSHAPHLDILGTIVDYLHCAIFISAKRNEAVKLLSKIKDIASMDPQVAFNMLCMCVWYLLQAGASCKEYTLSLTFDPLTAFDAEISFVFSYVLDLTDCLAAGSTKSEVWWAWSTFCYAPL